MGICWTKKWWITKGFIRDIRRRSVSYTHLDEVDTIGTIVHIAIDGEYKGNIVISDEVKENVKEALTELKSVGIKKTIMLTGDSKVVALSLIHI